MWGGLRLTEAKLARPKLHLLFEVISAVTSHTGYAAGLYSDAEGAAAVRRRRRPLPISDPDTFREIRYGSGRCGSACSCALTVCASGRWRR